MRFPSAIGTKAVRALLKAALSVGDTLTLTPDMKSLRLTVYDAGKKLLAYDSNQEIWRIMPRHIASIQLQGKTYPLRRKPQVR